MEIFYGMEEFLFGVLKQLLEAFAKFQPEMNESFFEWIMKFIIQIKKKNLLMKIILKRKIFLLIMLFWKKLKMFLFYQQLSIGMI